MFISFCVKFFFNHPVRYGITCYVLLNWSRIHASQDSRADSLQPKSLYKCWIESPPAVIVMAYSIIAFQIQDR